MTIPTWLQVVAAVDAVGAVVCVIGFRALIRYNHQQEES